LRLLRLRLRRAFVLRIAPLGITLRITVWRVVRLRVALWVTVLWLALRLRVLWLALR
jgi:hypothetical protein